MAVQINPDDIVLLGHGTYEGGAANFPLPAGIELHVLQPVGTRLRVSLARKLVAGQAVPTLWLMDGDRRVEDLGALGFPHVYANGENVPQLTLYPLGDVAAEFSGASRGMEVGMVDRPTSLQELLGKGLIQARIKEQRAQGKALRVFWLACANQLGTKSSETKSVGD